MKETNDEYHDDHTRLSPSMLGVLRRSPQEFEGRYITKTMKHPEPSESMNVGSMVHCLALEPELFDDLFVIKPDGLDRRTREGKLAYAELMASGKQVVSDEDFRTAIACVKALMAHDQIALILSQGGIVEQRINFVEFGVEMRCKPDFVNPSLKVILDIKTTKDASPAEFAKSVASYGYARQAALYMDAVAMEHGVECRFLFAVVCTAPPYEVACYELTDEAKRLGEVEAGTLVQEYIARCETNNWLPVWSSGIVPLDLPKWYRHHDFDLDLLET